MKQIVGWEPYIFRNICSFLGGEWLRAQKLNGEETERKLGALKCNKLFFSEYI
jgi:hypothetical protein